MPLQIPTGEYEKLLRIMGNFPEGVAVRDLLEIPGLGFSKRTLQRRLDQLVSERKLLPEGEGRARRYRLPAPPKAKVSYWEHRREPPESILREEPPEYGSGNSHELRLSPEALQIRASILRPLARRTPVGYKRSFLDDYQPNRSFYLSEALRNELARIGQVGMSELPAGTYLRQVMDRLIVDLSWNSSRLEGNTYSLLETQRLLELGEDAEGRAATETQMILNHKAAIEMLSDQAGEIDFNRYTICNLHALLSDNLLSDPAACGRVRSRPVGIGGTVFHPLEVPQQIEERFERILEKAKEIEDPFEQAFFVMAQLPYLQPFEDVNKRVSRLAANIPLVRHNLCPLSFVDVGQEDYVSGLLGVYELNRTEYLRDVFVWAYRRSCARYAAVRESLGDPDPFRLRHRAMIGHFVREVVQGGMDRRVAARWIAGEAGREIVAADRARFIEVVETELGGLHEGNIARYRLRPAEFAAWHRGWR